MNFLEVIKMQYDSGDTAQKKEFLKMAETLIMQNSGVRSFNPELCNALWGESHEAAAQLSSYFCPPITYPAGAMSTARGGDVTGTPALKTLQIEPPSRQRSAYLSQYFWNFMLSRKSREVVDMLMMMSATLREIKKLVARKRSRRNYHTLVSRTTHRCLLLSSGIVTRTLASHQFGLGLNSRITA